METGLKKGLLTHGFNNDLEESLKTILSEYGIPITSNNSFGETLKAIDTNSLSFNGLIINAKDLPIDAIGTELHKSISGMTGLIQEALSKKLPVIIVSRTGDNYFITLNGTLMTVSDDLRKNVTMGLTKEILTKEDLADLFIRSAEKTSFVDKAWDFEPISASDTLEKIEDKKTEKSLA
jgi:hypothetical protein